MIRRLVKPGFHYDRPDRPDRPSRLKNFRDDRATEAIACFHTIVSIASKTEDARSSAMFLGLTTEFWRNIRKQMADVNRRANLLACYLLILSILRRSRA